MYSIQNDTEGKGGGGGRGRGGGRAQELCESRCGRPGSPALTVRTDSVDVKQHKKNGAGEGGRGGGGGLKKSKKEKKMQFDHSEKLNANQMVKTHHMLHDLRSRAVDFQKCTPRPRRIRTTRLFSGDAACTKAPSFGVCNTRSTRTAGVNRPA